MNSSSSFTVKRHPSTPSPSGGGSGWGKIFPFSWLGWHYTDAMRVYREKTVIGLAPTPALPRWGREIKG